MNSQEDSGKIPVAFIPKPRRSIHRNYCSCQSHNHSNINISVMGRYRSSSQSSSEGVDEVDHCIIKDISGNGRQRSSSSPIPSPHSSPVRNSSFEYGSGDHAGLQSRSAPTTPKSKSLNHLATYSETKIKENNRISVDIFERSFTSIRRSTPKKYSPKQTLPKSDVYVNHNESISSRPASYFYICIAILLALIFQLFGNSEVNGYNESSFKDDLKKLMKEFSIDQDSVLQIASGVKSAARNNDITSFVFIFNNLESEKDKLEFITQVAQASAKLLRSQSKPQPEMSAGCPEICFYFTGNESSPWPISFSPMNFNKLTQEEIFSYKRSLDKNGVMLLYNLENISPHLMQPFHYYCDRENPYVAKAVIFFIFDVSSCGSPLGLKNKFAYVDRCLKEKWKELPDYKLQPLLTRVVGVILDIGVPRVFTYTDN